MNNENGISLKKPLAVMNDKDPIAIEQYRMLYTRIEQISLLHSYKLFAITSSVPGEGKTITSMNIASIMATEFKKKVILIECDLRRPNILSYFLNTNIKYGLANVIRKEVDFNAATIKMRDSNLFILPTLNKTNASSQLLALPAMRALLNTLKIHFDYIILDSPPILSLADMNIISKIADGVMLVVRAGKTPKSIVQKAIESLDNSNIVGMILNSTDTLLNKYTYRYGYYY